MDRQINIYRLVTQILDYEMSHNNLMVIPTKMRCIELVEIFNGELHLTYENNKI